MPWTCESHVMELQMQAQSTLTSHVSYKEKVKKDKVVVPLTTKTIQTIDSFRLTSFYISASQRRIQESERQRELVRGGKLSYPQSVASRTVRALWKAVARLPNDSVKLPEILERRGDSRLLGMDFLDGQGPERDNSIFLLMIVTAVEKSIDDSWNELFFCHINVAVFS